MTKEELKNIFTESQKEIADSLTFEKLSESIRKNVGDKEHIDLDEIISIVAVEIYKLNQEFTFKVLEKALCKD